MNTILSLTMVSIAFVSMVVLVAYVADVAACKFVDWLEMED